MVIKILHFGDITQIHGDSVPFVDVVTFGAPCQDLSIAGKRAGMKNTARGDSETTRSGLFYEAIRIIKEMRDESSRKLSESGTDFTIRDIKPRYAVYENVPGALSSNNGEDFRCVLEETAHIIDKDAVIPRLEEGQRWSSSGCILGDGWSIAWRIHDAQFWGVPQRRRRISLVADFGGITSSEILFERKSMSGNSDSCGTQGQGTSASFERDSNMPISLFDIGGNGTLNQNPFNKCLNPWDVQSKHSQPENGIAETLYSGECRYGGGESYVMQNQKNADTSTYYGFQGQAGASDNMPVIEEVTPTMRANQVTNVVQLNNPTVNILNP